MNLLRTTLQEIADGCALPRSGVYVVADNGPIYIGGATTDLGDRFRQHFHAGPRGKSQLGNWIYFKSGEWDKVRVDILEPSSIEVHRGEWIKRIEIKCIRKFKPLLNVHHNKGN